MNRQFKMSEDEKTRIALGVLAVIEEVGRMLRAPMPLRPEPTGIRINPNDEQFVTKRSA